MMISCNPTAVGRLASGSLILRCSLFISLTFGLGIGAAQDISFEDVTEAAGLKQPLTGIMGHGGAFGDVDGDGYLDLYVGGFADRPNEAYAPVTEPVPNVLLRNRGDGRFEHWPQKPVEIYARTSGAVFADLDNDGDPELYVANNSTGRASTARQQPQRQAQETFSRLFRNDNGRLHHSSRSGASIRSLRTARNVGVFDYDGDGLLDLFVVEDKFTKNPRSVLFRNLGHLKFEAANDAAGLPDDIFGLGLAVADINDDGYPDFFVGHSNRMFLSSANGRYVESPELNETFAWTPLDGEDWPCGAAFGDLNRDGRLDLVLALHGKKARNRVYFNEGLEDGIPGFRDVTSEVGLPPHLDEKSPHVEIQDFDNDGWPDIYLSAAWMDERGAVTPLIYRNLGQGSTDGGVRFRASFDPGQMGEGKLVYFPAGPTGDYDRDGKIDIFFINWFRDNHSRLMHNVSASENHWIAVRVQGKTFNRDGIGTQVKVFTKSEDGEKQLIGFQELSTGYGYASGQDTVCHFGLGQALECDLEVRLPNGKIVRREGVKTINQTITIKE